MPAATPMNSSDVVGVGSLPRIVLVGTGGTIAGSAAVGDGVSYQAGVVSIADLVGAVPGLDRIAALSYEQFAQIDSCDMTLERQLALARRVAELQARDDVDAVVVTHGTDTLEETAYLLHLVLPSAKPAVLVGAMRPADAPGADGPANLLAAVRTAACSESTGRGTLVVLGGAIHSARDLAKRHTSRVDAFASAHGPIGEVTDHCVTYYQQPARRFGFASAVGLAGLPESLPPVETVYGRAGLPASILQAYVASGACGLVYVGHGGGNIPLDLRDALAQIAAAGVPVVRASRVGEGVVARDGAVPDSALGLIAGDNLTPPKARILLALALTKTTDSAQIQEIFDTH